MRLFTISLVLYFFINIFLSWLNNEYLVNIETFFRYKISYFHELGDYFNKRIIENKIFSYSVKNNYLYTYGITGYTKVYLGLNADITKIINSKYDENYAHIKDGRHVLYSSIKELKEIYGNNLSLKKDFNDISDDDLKVFMDIYQKELQYKHDYEYIKQDTLFYKNGNEVMNGLNELNTSLINTYNRRFSEKQ